MKNLLNYLEDSFAIKLSIKAISLEVQNKALEFVYKVLGLEYKLE